MLTPQEVSERVFAKVSFGGYHMAAVDEFLDILTADYTALYSENTVLKSKMKVLVDKVDEYRATEDAMRKALMSAQRIADQLVREAEEQKEEILRNAQRDAAEQTAEIRRQTEAEQARLDAARAMTADFVRQVRQLQAAVLEQLEHLGELVPDAGASAASREDEAMQAIENSVQRIVEAQMASVREELAAEAETEAEVEEPTTDLGLEHTAEFSVDRDMPLFDREELPTPATGGADEEDAGGMDSTRVIHRDFGPLEFGRDYEIK